MMLNNQVYLGDSCVNPTQFGVDALLSNTIKAGTIYTNLCSPQLVFRGDVPAGRHRPAHGGEGGGSLPGQGLGYYPGTYSRAVYKEHPQ